MQPYVDIDCPIYHKKQRVYFVPVKDGWVANGCEDASGASTCLKCFEKAAEKLRKELELQSSSQSLSPLLNDPLSR